VVIEGPVEGTRMPRLSSAIAQTVEPASVSCQFRRDEEGRYVVEVQVAMRVLVPCQRCLEDMTIDLEAHSLLAAVWNDEQAAALPARYDPLITEGETNLWQLVEDELLLALPAYNYHRDRHCGEQTGRAMGGETAAVSASPPEEKVNPFSVLAALKNDENQG
jgi:uncharacterized protein